MSEFLDVIICGGGSAGLCAAIWLARGGIRFKILERRDGPLEMGQADGVQCRTVEIFESLGISEPLLREAYHVTEVAFWSSDGQGGIARSHFTPDTLPGLSHLPHVILNQARMNELMFTEAERLQRGSQPIIEYGCEVRSVRVDDVSAGDSNPSSDYPVEVVALKEGVTNKYRAKYVLACDGAHSTVRKSLGFEMIGDSSDAIWGVLDIYPRTDFPDIRKKVVIHSDHGSVVIIPREGDVLVRLYLELSDKKASDVTLEYLQKQVSLVLQPFDMEIVETKWWSAYSIGQRLASGMAKDNRVFLTGDACHTHSPKAGQGMNASLQDGYNIGWKLAHVLNGLSPPSLLETYVSERQKTAGELIDFDRQLTRLFSSTYRQGNNVSDEDFKEYFVQAGRYMAGVAVSYDESMLTMRTDSGKVVAANLTVGMRLPSVQVVRVCDARPMQLARVVPSDSRFHVVVFGGATEQRDILEEASSTVGGIIESFTPADQDPDSVINPILVLASNRTDVELKQVPSLFRPIVGRLKIKCRVFVDDDSYHCGHGHAYDAYGIDVHQGAIVVVRPDLYISCVLALTEAEVLRDLFEGVLLPQQGHGEVTLP